MGFRKRGKKRVNLKKAPGRAGTGCRAKKIREELGLLKPKSSQRHLSEVPLKKHQRRNAVI